MNAEVPEPFRAENRGAVPGHPTKAASAFRNGASRINSGTGGMLTNQGGTWFPSYFSAITFSLKFFSSDSYKDSSPESPSSNIAIGQTLSDTPFSPSEGYSGMRCFSHHWQRKHEVITQMPLFVIQ